MWKGITGKLTVLQGSNKIEAEIKEAGEKFLAENKKKEGVVTLPSGLQYQILKAGDGPKPTANDKVKTHYHGTLLDGKFVHQIRDAIKYF